MSIQQRVKEILAAEVEAIQNIKIDQSIEEAVNIILKCQGTVFTTGIGKAGYLARKIASTFSTTGTPSAFLHPAEAPHGDVGVIKNGDILIAYSNSGKTREVIETVRLGRALGISAVISVVGTRESELGELSDLCLEIGKIKEPCPLGFTPTASAIAMIAISDALALAIMEERGITKEDFALRHHGGYLGEQARK